jgi:hypothetical protein
MPLLITRLLGFFSLTGPLATFFYMIGKKLTLTALIVPIQITLIGALIVARISLATAITTLIILIYNKMNEVITQFESFAFSNVLSVPFKILQSMGIIQAFQETFAFFSLVFASLLLAFLGKLAVSSLQSISDEYYKIGVLLQLGLK